MLVNSLFSKFKLAATVLAAILLATQMLFATLVRPFGLSDLVREADVIVRGRVLSQACNRDASGERIYTMTHVAVLERFKGNSVPDRITLKQRGGTIGDATVHVVGTAPLAAGEEVLLFLRNDGRSYSLVGMSQGKFAVQRKSNGVQVVAATRTSPPAATAAVPVDLSLVSSTLAGQPYDAFIARMIREIRQPATTGDPPDLLPNRPQPLPEPVKTVR